MGRIAYRFALPAAVCLAAAARIVVPVVPVVTLAALLTLLIGQIKVPLPRVEPHAPRPRRSELAKHLDRRTRREDD